MQAINKVEQPLEDEIEKREGIQAQGNDSDKLSYQELEITQSALSGDGFFRELIRCEPRTLTW